MGRWPPEDVFPHVHLGPISVKSRPQIEIESKTKGHEGVVLPDGPDGPKSYQTIVALSSTNLKSAPAAEAYSAL